MTKQTNEHVLSYADYTQNMLLNPQAARKFVNDMRVAVKSLGHMPQRNQIEQLTDMNFEQ